MAVYPCEWSLHRYAAAQRSLYLTRSEASDMSTRKLRICPAHLIEAVGILDAHFTLVGESSQASLSCDVCGQPRQVIVFVKVFDQGLEPWHYALDACATHAEQALALVHWDQAIPR